MCHVPISETIIVAMEVEDGDWLVLVMGSTSVPGDSVSSTQTTCLSNEGRIVPALCRPPNRNAVTIKGEWILIGQK